MDPAFKKNKKKIKIKIKIIKGRSEDGQRGEMEKILFYFFFLSHLSSIYGNRTVGIRRGKNEKALLDEGYAWEPKTRDFAEFSIKIRKILCFDFSQIYGFLTVGIDRSRRQI